MLCYFLDLLPFLYNIYIYSFSFKKKSQSCGTTSVGGGGRGGGGIFGRKRERGTSHTYQNISYVAILMVHSRTREEILFEIGFGGGHRWTLDFSLVDSQLSTKWEGKMKKKKAVNKWDHCTVPTHTTSFSPSCVMTVIIACVPVSLSLSLELSWRGAVFIFNAKKQNCIANRPPPD